MTASNAAAVLGEQPVRMPKVDLAASFARPPRRPTAATAEKETPDRVSGLRAMSLARPAQRSAETESSTPVVEPAPVAAVAAVPPAPRRRRGNTTVISPIVVYMTPALRDALRRRRHETRDTLTAIVLDAIEAVHADLDHVLDAHRTLPVPGALFRHRAPTRLLAEDIRVQVGLRPAQEDLAVIDALVEKHQAPNRSLLIAATLHHYLNT
jgi:hypothetical protein